MREKIKLESSAGTGHFYTTTKNKRTMPEKMEIKKSLGPFKPFWHKTVKFGTKHVHFFGGQILFCLF